MMLTQVLRSRLKSLLKSGGELCFICSEEGGNDGLHEVTTFQVDQHVHK